MVEVREVKTRKDQKSFIRFPLKLYKDNPYFVPPLYMDEKALFKKNNPYNEQSESVFFIAVDNKKIVGRIHGILQRVSNEKWEQKRVRFTRFDSIDSQEVATALFNAVENWAKQKGMNEVVGPLGFSDLEREGLLIEGFDQISTFEEQYNYPYYKTLIEKCGYQKEVDWTESKLYAPEVVDPRIETISKKMMERYGLRLGVAKSSFDFAKRYGKEFFEVLDLTYEDIYQSVPFTKSMKDQLIGGFKFIVNVNYATVILDKNDKIVGFGIAFPSIGKAFQKSGGRLTLSTIFKVLKAVKKPKVIDLALIGIIPEYRGKAIATAIISEMIKMLSSGEIEYAETNLNLEDNANIQNQWKSFKVVQHKRRRCFVKNID